MVHIVHSLHILMRQRLEQVFVLVQSDKNCGALAHGHKVIVLWCWDLWGILIQLAQTKVVGFTFQSDGLVRRLQVAVVVKNSRQVLCGYPELHDIVPVNGFIGIRVSTAAQNRPVKRKLFVILKVIILYWYNAVRLFSSSEF